jgi:hypothetical protein
MNYEQDLKIDKLALDREWLLHSSIYFKYAEAQEHAEDVERRAKERLAVVKAQVYLDLLKENEKQGKKPTIPVMEALVASNPIYLEAVENLLAAQHEKGIIKAGAKAIDKNSTALENLVKLHLAGYFSDPKAQQEGDKKFNKDVAVEQAAKRQTESLKEKIK